MTASFVIFIFFVFAYDHLHVLLAFLMTLLLVLGSGVVLSKYQGGRLYIMLRKTIAKAEICQFSASTRGLSPLSPLALHP